MERMNRGRMVAFTVSVGTLAALTVPAMADILNQDFESVTGSPGADLIMGTGFNEVDNFDDGIAGENAFFGTVGNTQADASVAGSASGGVSGSGGAVFDVSNVTFNVLDDDLDAATGTGGGVFLVGDPNDPNAAVFNFTLSFDDGLANDRAFGGTFGGAGLNGSMSAQGLAAGGTGGTGGASIDVDDVTLNGGNWFAGLEFVTGSFPGVTPFRNASFETNSGSFDGWEVFSEGFNVNVETTSFSSPVIIPRTGSALAKMFGRFNGNPVSGIFQTVPAEPGQIWEVDGFFRHNTDDAMQADNFLVMRIEFFDAGGAQLQGDEVRVLDANSPIDVWNDVPGFQQTAPAGTVSARPVFTFVQPGFAGGAAHLDDLSFRLVSGTNPVNLADFAMSADIRGIADAAGESLGDVQLRLEDPQGNRLRFTQVATGSYASIGGALNTAVEADATDTPAAGVFNTLAEEYKLVVAFDNEASNPWGTGGTIEADNLLITNSDAGGSGWFGGIFFDGLKITEGDFSTLSLTADVKGNVVGGEYELRLEGFDIIEAGLDDDFSTVTGTGGGVFLDPNGGPGFLNNFDDGIDGESAFGGLGAGSSIFAGGFMSAEGVNDPNVGTVVEVRVKDVIVGVGSDWFAGFAWTDQGLASTDLSQVTMTADIRGITESGGSLGTVELRLEDAQGDRLFFQGTASNNFVTFGGTLDTATEGAALSGSGDGTFNLDSPSYTLAISFIDPATSWGGGGVIQVDNLFLTPVTIENEIGRVTFTGTADGNFNQIGGLLSDGDSTYGDLTTDLNGATGAGNLARDPNDPGVNGGPIDAGLDFFGTPNSFAGDFGGVLGRVEADGCTSCGVGGSGAARIAWDSSGAQGWFLGIAWPNVPLDLSGDLSQVELRADIKGTGATLGSYVLRVEDADLDILEFVVDADGSFQAVGGTLDTANPGSIPGSDGSFNFNQATYSVVMVVVEPGLPQSWGTTGGEIIVDNLFVTGTSFESADCHTVTVAFRDELNSWGTAGELSVDNIVFAENASTPCPGDTDGNRTINLTDLANCLANFGTGPGANVGQGDVDGNGFVDLTDLAIILANFGVTCP